jgi:hypothetical protein
VYDPGVYSYTAPSWILDPVTHTGVEWGSNAAYRSGVVFDQCILPDLPKISLKNYKAIVFSNTYALDNKMRKFIKDNVMQEDRHIIWNYMPGVINESEFNYSFVEELTGFKLKPIQLKTTPVIQSNGKMPEKTETSVWTPVEVLIPDDFEIQVIAEFRENKKPAIASRKLNHCTSWLCSLPLSNEKFMSYIFKNAGCHMYSNDNDVIHSGNGLLVLHTKTGGEKKILLKNGKQHLIKAKSNSTIFMDSNKEKEIVLSD